MEGGLQYTSVYIREKTSEPLTTGLRLRHTPLVIPHLEADYVELNGLATRQGGYLHEGVLHRKEHVTTLARFSGAWTTPGPRNAVVWQATIPELALDQEVDNIVGYRELQGGSSADGASTNARFTGVSTPESVNG
jgi:hypothetical protein